jgi:hypothetical protein
MSRGQLLPNEASLLFEMLVLVSNSFNDLNKQRAFLDDVLTNSLSFWTSPGTAAAVSSAKAYAAAVQGSDRQSRWQVQTTLTTFTCVAKRSRALPCGAGGTGVAVPQQHAGQLGAAAWSLQHPFVHKWAAILPNLFSLIRSLHALWRPEFRSPIEQAADIRWMVRISPLELMSIVGYEDHFESNSSSSGGSVGNSSSGGPSNYSSSSMHSPQSSRASASALNSANAARESDVELATQMTHARLRAYDLVALAAVHGASVQRDSQNYQRIQAVESAVTVAYRENPTSYTPGRGGLFDIPNVLGMIRQSLLSDLDSMEHRHFRSLLTAFFEPYCLSCPLPLFASHVRPVFIQLFEHAHKRVSDAWAGWNTGTGDATAARGGGGVRVGVGSAPEKKRVVNRCHMPLGVPAGSTELIYAKIIRDVGREVISTLAELIPARPPRRDPVTGRIVKQRPGNKRRTARQTPFYVSPLASLLLGDTGGGQHASAAGGSAQTVLRTLSMAVSWPDSATLGKVILVVERILPVVIVNAVYFPWVGGSLLLAFVRSLFSESPSSKENQHGLINVISIIYCGVCLGLIPVEQGGGGVPHAVSGGLQAGPNGVGSLGGRGGQGAVGDANNVAYRVFASLPGVSPHAMMMLNTSLSKEKSTKNRRLVVQEFLQTAAQTAKDRVSAGEEDSRNLDSLLEKKVLKVLNLPEPVVDHAKRAQAAAKAFEDARWSGASDAAVSQLFSSQ